MSSTHAGPRAADGGLRWNQGLQFRIACLFAILLAILASVAFYAAERLISGGVEQASYRHETSINRRLLAETQQVLRATEQFAQTLALTAGHSDAATITQLGEALLQGLPVASFGLWPEPASTAPGARHGNRYWQITAGGRPQLRGDDASTAVAWWREPWYTTVRLAGGLVHGCQWSAPYRDPLLTRDVVTCSVPLTGANGFEGVATVSLDVGGLDRQLLAIDGEQHSYAVLADRHGRLLALSAMARGKLGIGASEVVTLDALAARHPGYAAVATQFRERDQRFRAAALRSTHYDARLVSSLKDNTRNLSRDAAEDALAAVWNAADGNTEAATAPLRFENDPVLGETSYALLSTIPGSHWLLLSASAARDGSDASMYLTQQVLAITLGGSVLVLVLSFSLLRRLVLRPLRAMGMALADTTLEARTPTLDESGAGELRLIAHWHNERSERLAEMRDRADIATTQLHAENSERLRTQDALLRLGERLRLLTDSVDEGLVVLDERGDIEDLNGHAQQWLGNDPSVLRGQPFATVFAARVGSLDGPPLPDLMHKLREDGVRLDYPDGVLVPGNGGLGIALGISAIPLRSRFNRLSGAVIVMRRIDPDANGGGRAGGSPGTALTGDFVDPVTGLGGRQACERRLREVLGRVRDQPSNAHWLLAKLDFAELRRVRETRSHDDADTLAARCGERLAALRGGSEQVFRLAPDRFGLLIEADTAEQALAQAKTLQQQIAEQRLLDGEQWIELQAAIGLCRIDADVDSPAEAMRRAGLACDHARNGDAVVLHDEALETGRAGNDDLLWVRRIERGLEHRLFHLTTQSIQPARSHANDGEVFDVLPSLEDEEGFWAPLSAFLPVAERHQLGVQLDQWVIRMLFERLAASPDLGVRLAFCTIHLSADSLADAALIDFVADSINRNPQVPVGKLCFMLRNDTLTDHPQQAMRCLESLRALGCRTAIDHRNGRQIAYIDLLRKLPVSLLRLDARSFARIVDDQVEQTLAETAIRLARLNGSRTLITEIDSEAQATVWRRLGADYLQGSAIARPSPVPFKA